MRKLIPFFLLLAVSVSFNHPIKAFAQVDDCASINFDDVYGYCEYFGVPNPDCAPAINFYYTTTGHTDPDVKNWETIPAVAARTALGDSTTADLICHGAGGAGAGGGN